MVGTPSVEETSMTRTCAVGTLTFLMACVPVLGGQAPKPGPEQERLQPFVGNWTLDGEVKAGPFGPAGKVTGTDRVESLGGFFIQRNFQSKGPQGELRGTHIFGYDALKKTYVQSGYNSAGAYSSGTVTVSGNTWTFNSSGVAGGKPIQERCTVTFGAGNASLDVACDASTDGKTWSPTFSGKVTRSK
jgi:hypothetical protein